MILLFFAFFSLPLFFFFHFISFRSFDPLHYCLLFAMHSFIHLFWLLFMRMCDHCTTADKVYYKMKLSSKFITSQRKIILKSWFLNSLWFSIYFFFLSANLFHQRIQIVNLKQERKKNEINIKWKFDVIYR